MSILNDKMQGGYLRLLDRQKALERIQKEKVERTLYMRFRNSMKKAFILPLWQEHLDEIIDGRYPTAQRMMKKNNWLAFAGTKAVKEL